MYIIDLLVQSWPRLMSGLLVTVEATIISLCFAAVLGLVFGLMSVSRSKVLRGIARVYVDIIRGTPLIVQAFFIFFGISSALDVQMSELTAGIITLSLNAGAYTAELFRGGIEAVPRGQMEAARSLGLPYSKAMMKVIMPQAVRTMIPALVNQCIITLKDSSILSAIGMAELTKNTRNIIANNFKAFEMWLITGVIYFIIIMILSKISSYIERRMKRGKNRN